MSVLLETVRRGVKLLCSASIALMAAIVFMQVVNRNLFDSSFKWVEELATMCMVCITFLGAALATALNAHTRIELFVNLFPPRVSRVIFALGDLLCAAFSVALAVYCWPLIVTNLHTMSPAMKLPWCINYVVFTFAMGLSAVYLILRGLGGLRPARPTDVPPRGES